MTDHIDREKLKDRIRADDVCEVEAGIPPMTTTPDLIERLDAEIENLTDEEIGDGCYMGRGVVDKLAQLLRDCRDALKPEPVEHTCLKCGTPSGTNTFCSGYCQETYHGLG